MLVVLWLGRSPGMREAWVRILPGATLSWQKLDVYRILLHPYLYLLISSFFPFLNLLLLYCLQKLQISGVLIIDWNHV